jgi:hypothetical protein
MDFSLYQSVFLILSVVSVSLWDVIQHQTKTTSYPYKMGYDIFSLFQWVIILVGGILIFGFLLGFVYLLVCMMLLHYITHFTLGFIWHAFYSGFSQ